MERTSGYARVGRSRIAYEVFGSGEISLVISAGSFGAFDIDWEDPAAELFFRELASYARLIRFDRRGSGGSDPMPLDALPPWESFVEELDAVMDATGCDHSAIMASYDAGPMAMLFAATRPERTTALILVNTSAKYLETPDYPIGVPLDVAEELTATMAERWGTPEHVVWQVPSSTDDAAFREWYAKKTRAIAGPGAAEAYFRSIFEADARAILPAIEVPTLVLQRANYRFIPAAHGRHLAEMIKTAEYVELPGADGPLFWEHADLALDAIERFLLGVEFSPRSNRSMVTVLMTDIVESTRQMERLGDSRWRTLLDQHDEMARRMIDAQHGHLVKTTGDGILATFDGPGRALRFADEFRHALLRIALRIRVGIHAGEVELRLDDIGGMAVHLAARIMSMAGAGEIVVSRTVRELVRGSDLRFEDRGLHHLKGIEGEWQLMALVTDRETVAV